MSVCIQCRDAFYDLKCPNCGQMYEDYHYAPGCNFIFFCRLCGFKSDRLSEESLIREDDDMPEDREQYYNERAEEMP